MVALREEEKRRGEESGSLRTLVKVDDHACFWCVCLYCYEDLRLDEPGERCCCLAFQRLAGADRIVQNSKLQPYIRGRSQWHAMLLSKLSVDDVVLVQWSSRTLC